MNVAEIKAYQEKINAQLREAKALLDGFEAHTKGKIAQSEIDTISRLKTEHKEIENKVHNDLKTTGEVALAAKVKSDIEARINKFKASVAQLEANTRKQSAA